MIKNVCVKLKAGKAPVKTGLSFVLFCFLMSLMIIGTFDKLAVTADVRGSVCYDGRRLGADNSTIVWVPDNYTSIQEAIDEVVPGGIVYVGVGEYYEDVVVNKSLSLIGENVSTAVLDGEGESLLILSITASDVIVHNFTIKNTRGGQPAYGISIRDSQNVSLRNVVVRESHTGLVLDNSSQCEITNNTILENYAYGIDLRNRSVNNTIVGNSIVSNPTGLQIIDSTCQNNTFYHNNFVYNMHQIVMFAAGNVWDNGKEGNYWSDYTGADDGSNGRVAGDGVGDTLLPHQNVDYYPLMEPQAPFQPISPIAHFGYSPESPVAEEIVTFDASESYDPDGKITNYFWNFGDGSVSSKPSPKQGYAANHTYVSAGSYTVNLTVTDDDGLTNSFAEILVVQKMNSTLVLNLVPSEITAGNNVTISGYITPKRVGVDVTIYYMFWPEAWKKQATVRTEEPLGNYTYVWTAPRTGEWVLLKANWTGDEKTLGAEDIKKVTIEKALSSITVDVDPENVTVGSNVVISGKINPTRANINISVQIYRVNETDPLFDTTVKTDTNSFYTYVWIPSEIGAYEVQISWNGDLNTYPAESDTKTFNVEAQPPPTQNLLPYAIAAIIVALIAGSIYFFKRKS